MSDKRSVSPRTLYLATIGAALACAGAALWVAADADRKAVDVVYANSSAADQVRLVLPETTDKATECRRYRQTDATTGITTDLVELINGEYKVVTYYPSAFPVIATEKVFYRDATIDARAAADNSGCAYFVKNSRSVADLVSGARVKFEAQRDPTGKFPLWERSYNDQGKLTSAASFVVVDAEKKVGGVKTDSYDLAGTTTYTVLKNLKGELVSDTLYREDGTRKIVRIGGEGTKGSFEYQHFAADGNKRVLDEKRSYGVYGVTFYYDDGVTKRLEARSFPTLNVVTVFWQNGKQALTANLIDGGRRQEIVTFDKDGKQVLEQIFQVVDGKLQLESAAPMVGESYRYYKRLYYKAGMVVKVEEYPDFKPYSNTKRVLELGADGRITSDRMELPGDEKPKTTTYAAGQGPVYQVPASYLVRPDVPEPKELDKYDVSDEVTHMGMH